MGPPRAQALRGRAFRARPPVLYSRRRRAAAGRKILPLPPFRARVGRGILFTDGRAGSRRPGISRPTDTGESTVPTAPALAELQAHARSIRRAIITGTTTAGSGHPTSSLSAVEVAVALDVGGFLRYDPKNPQWPQRDRFILSKGHAAPLLYAVLAEAGFFSRDLLPTLRKLGSPLEGHPNMRRLPGVEASTGSLGQGLSLGVGHALATRMDGYDARVYVLLGDGELDEGQVWEAAMAGHKFKLDNLVCIV